MSQYYDASQDITWNYTLNGSNASIGDGTTIHGNATTLGTSLTGAITIPSTLDGYTVTGIGQYAFRSCTSLTSIDLSGTQVTNIGQHAFRQTGLTSIVIPDSVTNIDAYAFRQCTSLETIDLGNSLTTIRYYAFDGCTGLTSIVIPDSVTYIKNNAFSQCTSLTSITIPDSVTNIETNVFNSIGSPSTVYVKDVYPNDAYNMSTLQSLMAGKISGTVTYEQWVDSNANANANTAPHTVTLSDISCNENTPYTATVSATDDDSDSLTFSLSGTDSADFTLTGTTLSANAVFDFEIKSTHNITITASDGSLNTSADFTITVNNIQEGNGSGDVSITGSVAQGQQLSAVTTVTDPDTITSTLYQWLRCDNSGNNAADIGGATQSTYQTVQADVDSTIRVKFTFTDGLNHAYDMISAQTAVITNVNDAPTVANILGNLTRNEDAAPETISLANTFADLDGDSLNLTVSNNNSSLVVASLNGTDLTLTYQAHQHGSATVTVTASDTYESVDATFTITVNAENDALTGSVTVDGTMAQGATLTANTSGLSDNDGMTSNFNYQWLRCDYNGNNQQTIAGAQSATYTLRQVDVGSYMKVTVTHTDVDGNIESKTSGAESAVANVNDAPTGLPTITTSGEFAQGNTLTCVTSGIADADGLGAFTYTWKRNGVAIANPNGNSNQYTLIQSDVGAIMTVMVSYTDGYGNTESLTSAASNAVLQDAPSFNTDEQLPAATEGTPYSATITCSDLDGDMLAISATTLESWLSAIDNSDNTMTISGTPTQSEVGAHSAGYIVVEAHDTYEGQRTTSKSFALTVNNTSYNPSGSVSISGTAQEDQVLTASNNMADQDGPSSLSVSYKWYRGASEVGTGATYTLGQSDVGSSMTVKGTYTDGEGSTHEVASPSTSAVVNVNDAPAGDVTISGTTTQYEVLTASNSLTDEDGPSALTVSYQWKRDDSDIIGETGSTYTLTQNDVNKTISVTASYTDAHSNNHSVNSAPTASIANVNDAPYKVGRIPNINVNTVSSTSTSFSVTPYFADLDGDLDSYNYSATSSNGDVTTSFDGSILTLSHPQGSSGFATIKVTANDGNVTSGIQRFNIIRKNNNKHTTGKQLPPNIPTQQNGKRMLTATHMELTSNDISIFTAPEKRDHVKANIKAAYTQYKSQLGSGEEFRVAKSTLPFAKTSSKVQEFRLRDATTSSSGAPHYVDVRSSAGFDKETEGLYVDMETSNVVEIQVSDTETLKVEQTGETTFNVSKNGAADIVMNSGDVIVFTDMVFTLGSITGGSNSAPITYPVSYSVNEDSTANVMDLSATDVDVEADGDFITYVLDTLPSHGTLNVALGDLASGQVTYSPDANYYGADSFTYHAKDSYDVSSNVSTVSINVASINDVPVFTSTPPTNLAFAQATVPAWKYTVSATDIDSETHGGSTVTFSATSDDASLNTGITVTNDPLTNDAIVYIKPDATYMGSTGTKTSTVTVTATDASGGSQTQQFVLTSSICFPDNTPVNTDQGLVMIQNLDINKHTINNKKIVSVTNTRQECNYLVQIKKNALGNNTPSQTTRMTKDHKLAYQNEMVCAKDLLHLDGVYKVAYNGCILHNVLMEDYETMEINNMTVETLHPDTLIAKIYNIFPDGKMTSAEYKALMNNLSKTNGSKKTM